MLSLYRNDHGTLFVIDDDGAEFLRYWVADSYGVVNRSFLQRCELIASGMPTLAESAVATAVVESARNVALSPELLSEVPRCCQCNSEAITRHHGDDCYCSGCFDEALRECEHCDAQFVDGDGREMLCRGERHHFCATCGPQMERCQNCRSLVHADDLETDNHGTGICSACRENHYTRCEGCNRLLHDNDVCFFDDTSYCSECVPNDDDDDNEDEEWSQGNRILSSAFAEIGSRRMFGVELETASCPDHWRLKGKTVFGCKRDGSISGKEFVSPPLQGDDGLVACRSFLQAARGFSVNSQCGYHLHLDCRHECGDSLKKIALGYYYTEALWFSFVSRSRQNNQYCQRLPFEFLEIFSSSDGGRAVVEFGRRFGRYYWLNVSAYQSHRTYEVRLHNGTLAQSRVLAWIKAHTRFADYCSRMESVGAITARFAPGDKSMSQQFQRLAAVWGDSDLSRWFAGRAKEFHDMNYAIPFPMSVSA